MAKLIDKYPVNFQLKLKILNVLSLKSSLHI